VCISVYMQLMHIIIRLCGILDSDRSIAVCCSPITTVKNW